VVNDREDFLAEFLHQLFCVDDRAGRTSLAKSESSPRLPSQDDLPFHRNTIGDMYLVCNVPFVWLFAPGASRAGWIDP
jgi:hypothetical protein